MSPPGDGSFPPVERCLNCGTGVASSAYCPDCGQRAVDLRVGIRGLLREAAALASSFDSKILRTAWTLLAHPGRVAADYVAGHRVRWVSPVRIFLGAAALYVLLGAGYAQRLSAGDELRGLTEVAGASDRADEERLRGKIEATVARVQQSMPTILKAAFVLSAPALVLLLALVEARRRRPLFDHAVTGLYLMTVVAAFQLAEQPVALLVRAVTGLPPLRAHLASNLLVGLVFLGVVALWLRRVYGDRTAAALAKSLVVLLGFEVAISVWAAVISVALAVLYVT